MEMIPEEDTDPCELCFREYRESKAGMLPGRIEVRHGDELYGVFQLQTVSCSGPTREINNGMFLLEPRPSTSHRNGPRCMSPAAE